VAPCGGTRAAADEMSALAGRLVFSGWKQGFVSFRKAAQSWRLKNKKHPWRRWPPAGHCAAALPASRRIPPGHPGSKGKSRKIKIARSPKGDVSGGVSCGGARNYTRGACAPREWRENVALTILFTIPIVNRHGFVHAQQARIHWFVHAVHDGTGGIYPSTQCGVPPSPGSFGATRGNGTEDDDEKEDDYDSESGNEVESRRIKPSAFAQKLRRDKSVFARRRRDKSLRICMGASGTS
jgi:hypothetical protein